MKTVVFISDTHRQLDHLVIPPCDLLIHSGDEDLDGEQPCLILNDWFGKQPAKNIILVPGNHDFYAQEETEHFRELMTNAKVLIDEYVEIDSLKIYGSPWTPTFYDWAFMKPDLNLTKHWEKIPMELDILITHGPPFGILDANVHGHLCGSKTLYQAVAMKERNIKIHCFGHIHEGYGEKVIENTRFINAACCPIWTSSGYYEKDPVIIEFEER